MRPEQVTEDRPSGDLVSDRGPDGVVRCQGDIFWLSQKQMSELFGVDVRTINEHLGNIYAAGELVEDAIIRIFRMVRTEGNREVSREITHYALDAAADGHRP